MEKGFLYLRQKINEAFAIYRKAKEDANVQDIGLSASVERKTAPFTNGHFTLAVLGEMSSGKSLFINCFLGKPGLLPTGRNQTTCVLTEIEHTDGPETLIVKYADGHEEVITGEIEGKLAGIVSIPEEYDSLPLNHVNQLIIEGDSPDEICEQIDELENVAMVEIDIDNLRQYAEQRTLANIPTAVRILCRLPEGCEGWRIIDTPGVDAIGGIDTVTMELLAAKNPDGTNNVDAIIFLKKASSNIQVKSFNEFVRRTFATLSDDARSRIFFILTHGATSDYLDYQEDIDARAHAIFVKQYGIPAERFMVIDSLCERLLQYIGDQRDAKQLMALRENPDSSWTDKDWKAARTLFRQIDSVLDDRGVNVNNSTLKRMLHELSAFDALRAELNSFAEKEKYRACVDAIDTMIADLQQHHDLRKNILELRLQGLDAIRAKLKELEKAQAEAQLQIGEALIKFSQTEVNNRFKFIDGVIDKRINNPSNTIEDIKRESVNLRQCAEAERRELMEEIKSFFINAVKLSIDTSGVYFPTPDFEDIYYKSKNDATSDVPIYEHVPGGCCRKAKKKYIRTDKVVDETKLRNVFRKNAVEHAFLAHEEFKKEINATVDNYIKEANKALKAAIDRIRIELLKLLEDLQVGSPEEMAEVVKTLVREVKILAEAIDEIKSKKPEL